MDEMIKSTFGGYGEADDQLDDGQHLFAGLLPQKRPRFGAVNLN